jgi:hypothetical protein
LDTLTEAVATFLILMLLNIVTAEVSILLIRYAEIKLAAT